MQRLLKLTALLTLLFVPASWATTYQIDKDHTTVGFSIRHLFSKVQGNFGEFQGTLDYGPGKPETWKAEATIQAASINTNVAGRDKHLRGPDFFDVEKYPTITFKSTGVQAAEGNRARLNGLLTIHGVEKPVTLDVEVHGEGKDPWGNTRLGATVKTSINRKDFGLNWNKAVESGQVLVGDKVDITIEVEGLLEEAK